MTLNTTKPVIEALSPGTVADLLGFFEDEAFSDNPAWSSCYCQCFYEDHSQVNWQARTAMQNRECALQRCAAGEMRGLLAYVNGRVVGWCNAAPRHLLHALDPEPVAEAGSIGCILCFVISPAARRKGVATALLMAACEALRAQGLLYAEANPRIHAAGSTANHFGHLAMYLAAGFLQHRIDESDDSVWVRKRL